MLQQLIVIKRQREQSARQRIAQASLKLQEHQQKIDDLRQEQKNIRAAWSISNQQARQVVEYEMRIMQEDLNTYYHQDKKLTEQFWKLSLSMIELEKWQDQQKAMLARARIEQEKLTWLMEQEQ